MRVAERHGTDDLVLLFADTLMEDEDLYRFLSEATERVDGTFVRLADGRDPWEVFFDVRFLGNHHVDPCSRILKRDLCRKWIYEHCDPTDTVIYLGLDWTEPNRLAAVRNRPEWEGWTVESPMSDRPLLDKQDMLNWLRAEGIEPPRLYAMGFPHNNCGGFCIKAGQTHFKLLYETMPDRYAYHEQKEQDLRAHLERDDIAILTDRSDGRSGKDRRPMTLREFRETRLIGDCSQVDLFEWGGCACF